MSKIVAGGCGSYDVPLLKEFFFKALAEFGALPAKCKVLLKPNLLSGKAPGRRSIPILSLCGPSPRYW